MTPKQAHEASMKCTLRVKGTDGAAVLSMDRAIHYLLARPHWTTGIETFGLVHGDTTLPAWGVGADKLR